MNKIESGEKLDFHNVLIRPKRSTLNSRSEVNLHRQFKFKYSPNEIVVTPIIAANMDSTGTFEVHDCLSKYNMITAFHKFYSIEDYKAFQETNPEPAEFMISTGINDNAIEKLKSIFEVIHYAIGFVLILQMVIFQNWLIFAAKLERSFQIKLLLLVML